jgi:hypothetical protein
MAEPDSGGNSARPTSKHLSDKRGSSRMAKKLNPKQTLKKLKVGPSNTDNLESDDSDIDDVEVYRVNATIRKPRNEL